MTARNGRADALRRVARDTARAAADELLAALRVDDDTAALRALSLAAMSTSAATTAYVAALRAAGVPWSTIGDALGMTRQGAAQRFGGSPRDASGRDDPALIPPPRDGGRLPEWRL